MKTGDTIKIKSNNHKGFIFKDIRNGDNAILYGIYPNSTYLHYKESSLEYCSQILLEKELYPWKGLYKENGTNVFGFNLKEVKGGLKPKEIQ